MSVLQKGKTQDYVCSKHIQFKLEKKKELKQIEETLFLAITKDRVEEQLPGGGKNT